MRDVTLISPGGVFERRVLVVEVGERMLAGGEVQLARTLAASATLAIATARRPRKCPRLRIQERRPKGAPPCKTGSADAQPRNETPPLRPDPSRSGGPASPSQVCPSGASRPTVSSPTSHKDANISSIGATGAVGGCPASLVRRRARMTSTAAVGEGATAQVIGIRRSPPAPEFPTRPCGGQGEDRGSGRLARCRRRRFRSPARQAELAVTTHGRRRRSAGRCGVQGRPGRTGGDARSLAGRRRPG